MIAYTPVYLIGWDSLVTTIRKAFADGAIKPLLENAFGSNGVIDDLATLLSASNSIYDSGFRYAQSMIENVIQPIGIALIITFFLINIMTIVSRDALTLDGLIKQLITLVIVFAFATQSTAIGQKVLSLGDTMIKQTAGEVELTYSGSDERYTRSEDTSEKAKQDQAIADAADGLAESYSGFGGMIIAAAIWVLAKLSQVGMFAAVISRGIELIWRTMFMPIGLANSFEGASSPGIRYLKAYIGTALSGAMMVIIIIVGYDLSLGILGSATTTDGLMRLIMAGAGLSATAGAAMSASSKIREVFS